MILNDSAVRMPGACGAGAAADRPPLTTAAAPPTPARSARQIGSSPERRRGSAGRPPAAVGAQGSVMALSAAALSAHIYLHNYLAMSRILSGRYEYFHGRLPSRDWPAARILCLSGALPAGGAVWQALLLCSARRVLPAASGPRMLGCYLGYRRL